ncbi:MAG: hypothetical protein QW398_07085 [Desulfurococcaceae archaeon]
MSFRSKLEELINALEQYKEELYKHCWYPSSGESLKWWAGFNNPFHIAVTAVLVAMTKWSIAERAFNRLTALGLSNPEELSSVDPMRLAEELKGVSFRVRKAKAIVNLAKAFKSLSNSESVEELRAKLLAVGIGRETADAIALYAFNKQTIPVSRQTTRVFKRYGVPVSSYESMRKSIVEALNGDLYKLKLLHSAMTVIAREYCKPKRPVCKECPLKNQCRSALTPLQF